MNIKSATQLAAKEPYRAFFPIAILVGIIGVALWPIFYKGCLSFYPLQAHSRLMIEGFVGGCAVGFLGTALPKMLNVRYLSVLTLLFLLALYISFCIAHLLNHQRTGDALFAMMLLTFISSIVRRVRSSCNRPNPSMVLAGMGILSGLAGAIWLATHEITYVAGGVAHSYLFAEKLLYQAFILLPLLGVGSFIFKMILASKKKPQKFSNKQWNLKAFHCFLTGAFLVVSYWFEVIGHMKMMSLLRFSIAFLWISSESGWLSKGASNGVMAYSLKAGIACLMLSLIAPVIYGQETWFPVFPEFQRIGLDHILYIGGFGLITLVVASRVIYGHSGQRDKFDRWMKGFLASVLLVLLAMATRASADFLLEIRISHHVYAAFSWILASIIWAIALIPSVLKRPPAKLEILQPFSKEPLEKKPIRDFSLPTIKRD